MHSFYTPEEFVCNFHTQVELKVKVIRERGEIVIAIKLGLFKVEDILNGMITALA